MYGYLNRELKLKCTVNHGIPNGKLVWMVHNQTLEEKRTASLVYSFVPKQQDYLQNYTCATKSDIAQYSMERTVQLFIYSKYFRYIIIRFFFIKAPYFFVTGFYRGNVIK